MRFTIYDLGDEDVEAWRSCDNCGETLVPGKTYYDNDLFQVVCVECAKAYGHEPEVTE